MNIKSIFDGSFTAQMSYENNRGQTTIYVVNKSRTNSKYLKRLVSAPGAVKQAVPLKEKVKNQV